jgi:hypothetical protein
MLKLKHIYSLSLVLLIIMGNVIIMQQQTGNTKTIKSGVLGVFSGSTQTPATIPSKLDPATTSKLELSMSDKSNPNTTELRLDGNGCQNNVFPSECKVISSTNQAIYLKNCTEQAWEKCNFYTYTLGKRDGNTQYIIQKYVENTDILVDILSYDIQTTVVGVVKTVLYQDKTDISDNVKQANQEYTDVLGIYSVI